MPNWFQKSTLITIAAIVATNGLPQEKAGRRLGQEDRQKFAFQNLTATKSIDLVTFRAGEFPEIVSIKLHALSIVATSPVKESATDEPFQVPLSTKPVPKRLGGIELFTVKPDVSSGFHQSRGLNLNPNYFASSQKHGLTDLK
jgi:hypothetical protein